MGRNAKRLQFWDITLSLIVILFSNYSVSANLALVKAGELSITQYKWYWMSWTSSVVFGGIGNTGASWSNTYIYRNVPNLQRFRYLSLGLGVPGGTAQWKIPCFGPAQCEFYTALIKFWPVIHDQNCRCYLLPYTSAKHTTRADVWYVFH